MQLATFGGGCFWGIEFFFQSVQGVRSTRVGYMGGSLPNPSYAQVCRGDTGHVEVVEVTFDPQQLSYQALLELFWQLHDPAAQDNQGPYEVGPQYRAVIFTHTPEQAALAHASKAALAASGVYAAPIVTEIRPAGGFWPAEEEHQNYIARGGAHHCNVFSRSIQLPGTQTAPGTPAH